MARRLVAALRRLGPSALLPGAAFAALVWGIGPLRVVTGAVFLSLSSVPRVNAARLAVAAFGAQLVVWQPGADVPTFAVRALLALWIAVAAIGVGRLSNALSKAVPDPWTGAWIVAVLAITSYLCVPETGPLLDILPLVASVGVLSMLCRCGGVETGPSAWTFSLGLVCAAALAGGAHRDSTPIVAAFSSLGPAVAIGVRPGRWSGQSNRLHLGALAAAHLTVSVVVSRTAGLRTSRTEALILSLLGLAVLALAFAGVAATTSWHRPVTKNR